MLTNPKEEESNGVTLTSRQVNFWKAVIVGAIVVVSTYYGASHPAQSQTSFDNQVTAIQNQLDAKQNQREMIDLLKSINQKLEATEKKK